MSLLGSSRVARADPSCIEKLEAIIDQMPANPEPRDDRLTMRQLVHRLYQKILHLKALGYGIRFICKLLQTHSGLPFKEHTLATYLSLEKLGGRGTTRRSRSSRSAAAGRSVAPGKRRSAAVVPPEVEPKAVNQPVADIEGEDCETVAFSRSASSSLESPNHEHREAALVQEAAAVESDLELSREQSGAEASPEPATAPSAQLPSDEPDPQPEDREENPDENPEEDPDWSDDAPIDRSSVEPERAESGSSPLRQSQSWDEDDPGNPPAPEPYLNEPTFNTIERD